MRFPKLGRRDKDVTRLEYNDYVTLTGIPAEAQGYSISGRNPLEWIIDRYHVKTDKASAIRPTSSVQEPAELPVC